MFSLRAKGSERKEQQHKGKSSGFTLSSPLFQVWQLMCTEGEHWPGLLMQMELGDLYVVSVAEACSPSIFVSYQAKG